MPGMVGTSTRSAHATVFDFAGVSVALQLPFSMSRLGTSQLRGSAHRTRHGSGHHADRTSGSRAAVPQTAAGHHETGVVDNFWEEYFVFQFEPGTVVDPETLLGSQSEWLAGLLRLEDEQLSQQEITEALRLVLRTASGICSFPIGPPRFWSSRSGVGRNFASHRVCQSAVARISPHRSQRVDGILSQADDLLRRVSRSRLPASRGHDRPVCILGELKVEANGLFERTGNVLKLVGDQYLARVYRLLATRFHLPEWEKGIRRKNWKFWRASTR